MSSKFLSLVGLKEFIGQQNPIEAKEFLENIAKFFDDQLSKAELDLAVEAIFNTQTGTLAFLVRSIKERKLFSDSNVIIFNIWINIIVNHGNETNFESYIESILQCCMQYIISTQVSAKEKEKSVIVLQELFKKKLVTDYDSAELVSKLLEVFNIKKIPVQFTNQSFKLLGIIAKDTPENVYGPNIILIRDVLLKALEETLLNEKSFESNVMSGAMEGLCDYLVNFAPSITDESQICQRIYVCVKKLSDPPDYVSAKAPFRAALDVLTLHYTLFAEQIYKDFKYWHDLLIKWYSSSIYDDRRKGIFAVHSFHKTLEGQFIQLKDTFDKNILTFLMNYFRGILESSESRPHETRIAIRGFGMMSLSCKMYLPEFLENMLSLVIQRTELISIAEDNTLRDCLEHFPDYVEALSQIIVQIGDIQVAQNLSLSFQSIVIRLIRDFHYLSKAHTRLVANSLCSSFYNLSDVDGSFLDDILEKVILQGVIWTCSNKLQFDANLDWSSNIDWKDNITYKFYMPLWESLLDESVGAQYDKPLIAKKIFNYLIISMFTILDKLDLRTKRRVFTGEDGKDQEFYFCDPNIDLCPEKPEDFQIFFNLVDFYRAIFYTKFRRDNFYNWINEYCVRMIKLAIKYPLISGFLKLLESGLCIAEFLKYFTEDSQNETVMLEKELTYFLKTLISKCQKVSGELQISCLELIMKYPVQFYSEYILNLIPIFQIAFDFGKSLTGLAKLAVESLEKIYDKYSDSTNDLRIFCEKVLPNLDTYLQSKGFLDDITPEIYNYKNRKRIRKTGGQNFKNTTELFDIQKKILNFLGKLDPQYAVLVVDKNGQTEDLVKWHVEQNIKLTLYFPDIRPEIYLDTIVPRICYLAITSSDRKTKIAACEIVHTLVLYLLGTRHHKGTIWKELCAKILILGSETDTTVQEMFKPLLMQLMHFMSKYENLDKGVDILMGALMEGISNNSNCSIRDLSAVCLREFVEWSIKQTTPQQLAASPVSIEMILQQLKIYSFDSNGSKRIGAALAFNNLYRNLREEESICDFYFIDLLYTFCVNYKLTEELSSTIPGNINSDLEQISLSLDHVVRVLKQRNYLFNKTSVQRKIPSAIGDNGTLKDVVIFLLFESGAKLINYRRKCLNLCVTLSTHLENISSLSQFLSKYVTEEMLFKICEGTPDSFGIKARPTLNNILDLQMSPYLLVYNWLQYFLSSLDCYTWFLGDNVLNNPSILFQNPKIFEAIIYYLNNICWKSMYEIVESINPDYLNETAATVLKFSIEEMNKIESIKCIICVQIIDFITSILNAGCANNIPQEIWINENARILIKFIMQIIYEPHHLEFDFKSEEISTQLPKYIEKLLRNLKCYCPNSEFLKALVSNILKNLIDRIKELSDQVQEILNSERVTEHQLNTSRGILFIMENFHLFEQDEKTVNAKRFLQISGERLITDLFEGIKEKVFNKDSTVNLLPDVKKFGNQLIRIAFKISDITDYFVNYIMDNNQLELRGLATKIQHGEYFFVIYKRAILEQCKNDFLVKIIPKLFQLINKVNFYYIIKILQEIIEFSYKYRQHDQNTLETLVTKILEYIPKVLTEFTDKNDILIIVEFLTYLSKARPNSWSLTSYRNYVPTLEEWILKKLKDKIPLEQKSRIITLLPLLIGEDDIEDDHVTDALQELQRQHFPLISAEFQRSSLEETGLKIALKSLLDAMIASKSIIILKFIIESTGADPKHILEYMIREYLKLFVEKLNVNQQIHCFKMIFKFVCNTTIEPQVRLIVLNRFVIPTIEYSNESAIITCFIDTFGTIGNILETNYSFDTSGWEVEHALVDRIVAFNLIELFFGSLPKEKYYYTNCPFISSFLPNESAPNAFLGALSKRAVFARKEVFITADRQAAEYFRIYQCAAYRTLCAIVCNTQNDLKFYTKFLFEENLTKHDVIWSKIIDCSDDKEYIFGGQELEEYPKIKERFVSIRRLNPRQNVTGIINPVKSSKYLQTQNVFSSSLSQDVNKIDLNYSMVRTDADAMIRKEMKSLEKLSVKLERHALNKHEIMPTLCAVIMHMHENKITPVVQDSENSKKSYPWIVYIANAIGNWQNHKNIRIFLTQVVDNCREVFEPYAHIFFKPILEVLCDECAGEKLNFFITDIIALLLSWTSKNIHKPTSDDEKRLASTLLKFVMKNAWADSKNIYKFNLELIQTMISLWKDVITIPDNLLFDMITKTSRTDSKENECGIILVGIVLANELIPWSYNLKIIFIRKIFENLNNDYCAVYQPSAHVLGIILATLKRNSDEENIVETIEIELKVKLKNLLSKKENKKEKIFIDIIYGVHKNYPEILDHFRETISYKIPSALGSIKKLYLEMLLTRLDAYDSEEIYSIIISIGIRNLLKNSEYQLIALHILNRSLSKLSINEIENIFGNIENCSESIKPEIRDVSYEILIYIVQNLNDTELAKKSEILLLKGLLDVDPEIQKRIFQYWSKDSNLSLQTPDRITSLISKYSTKCEHQFLSFCAQLILEPAIQNSESKSQIFPFETDDDAKLEEYTINTSSRIRTSSLLPPLFASTQQTWSPATGSIMCNFIRKTNNEYFFEPTQDPGKITQVRPNFTLPTQNSLPFGIQPQILDRRSQKINTFDIAQNSQSDESMEPLRKRFHKDRERENRQRALQAIDNRFQRMSYKELKHNQNNVILYRRYRHGDYPDLLINSLAFLLPLQGLAKRDRLIARQIFVSIFNAVLEKLNSTSHQFIVNIGAQIQNIFDNSKTCDSTVFATFLEIALLKPEVFNIKPETIRIIAKACNMLTIGAIYLENRLNCDWDTNTSLRSVKSNSTIDQQEQHWLELSDIYSSLAEYDIVAAIFSDKMDTDPRLAQAIEMKSNGRYSEAQQLLIQVIQRERLVEHYYSYNCYYECFVELGDWSSLSLAIKHQIDDYKELWDDEYNTNFYLPKLIQSELNLILSGENQSQEFLSLLEGWMVDPIKAEHLKMFFCEELMMLHIANQDYLQARVYCENHMKRFLIEWGVISSHYKKLRQETLLNTQKVAEIDHYAVLLSENLNDKNVNLLIENWSKCEIDRSDSLRLWNSILGYRTYITALIKNDLHNMGSEIQITDKLEETIYKMNIKLFNAAIYQKNTGIADRILQVLLPIQNAQKDNLYLQYEVAQIKRTYLQSSKIIENIQAIETLEQAWIRSHQTLNDENLKTSSHLHIEVLNLNSKIGMEILKLIPNTNINPIITENLSKLVEKSTKINLNDKILDESFLSLKESTNIADNLLDSDSNKENIKIYADTNYRLAQFCYDHYQLSDLCISEELQKTLIKSIFNAMKYDSKDSRQLFACVLQIPILENDKNFQDYFKESSSDVPDWMFLSWIPQILSRIQLKSTSYLDDIIQRIARTYPNALIYPFNVWFDNAKTIQRQQEGEIHIIRQELQNCIENLRNPLIEKFIEVFKTLCLPQIQLSTIINTLIPDLSSILQEQYEEKINAIIDIIYKSQNPDIYGSEFRKLITLKDIFETLKLCNVHEEMPFIQNKLKSILDDLSQIHIPNEIRIENLSPWLSKFQWSGEEDYLELPGQYTGDKRPFLENHIKIVKFGETAEIFRSLRRPMKIEIYGSDAKSYDFLIKFGEDLKQDQRIQQILNLMSTKLNEDRNCRNHNLFIRTYKVIPIKSDFGMISWVAESTTMQNFIYKSFLRRVLNGKIIWEQNIKKYQKFIEKPCENFDITNRAIIYGKAVTTYTRENIIQNFRALENNVDLNIIKYALIDISISPESFFVLRNNYATSLAAMNIAHWILGIGDRHLENILINTKNANLIGIDFGCVFGAGTFLRIPEMMPFRLTPHFVYAMNPMGTSGLLYKCMEHTLRVFRSSKKILLACMEVFVREPTIDWLMVKYRNTNINEYEMDENIWKPKDRIDIAKCKLTGYNPMQLFEKELRAGQITMINMDYAEGYIKLLRGHEQFNIRNRLPENNLTVEEQVKCLIDLATDPALLGCAWEGYLPWI